MKLTNIKFVNKVKFNIVKNEPRLFSFNVYYISQKIEPIAMLLFKCSKEKQTPKNYAFLMPLMESGWYQYVIKSTGDLSVRFCKMPKNIYKLSLRPLELKEDDQLISFADFTIKDGHIAPSWVLSV